MFPCIISFLYMITSNGGVQSVDREGFLLAEEDNHWVGTFPSADYYPT